MVHGTVEGDMFSSRRSFLQTTGCGFGWLAASALAQRQAVAAGSPLITRHPHHAAKAKRVIFLFMQGGVSHVDSFDYKERLIKDDRKIIDIADARAIAKTGKGVVGALEAVEAVSFYCGGRS